MVASLFSSFRCTPSQKKKVPDSPERGEGEERVRGRGNTLKEETNSQDYTANTLSVVGDAETMADRISRPSLESEFEFNTSSSEPGAMTTSVSYIHFDTDALSVNEGVMAPEMPTIPLDISKCIALKHYFLKRLDATEGMPPEDRVSGKTVLLREIQDLELKALLTEMGPKDMGSLWDLGIRQFKLGATVVSDFFDHTEGVLTVLGPSPSQWTRVLFSQCTEKDPMMFVYENILRDGLNWQQAKQVFAAKYRSVEEKLAFQEELFGLNFHDFISCRSFLAVVQETAEFAGLDINATWICAWIMSRLPAPYQEALKLTHGPKEWCFVELRRAILTQERKFFNITEGEEGVSFYGEHPTKEGVKEGVIEKTIGKNYSVDSLLFMFS